MKLKKPLPRVAVIGIVVAGCLFVAVVGYLVLVKPQNAKAKNIDAQTAQIQQQITDYSSQKSQRESAPKIRVADVYRLQKAMPSSRDIPDLLLELDRIASDTGVQLQQIQPADGPDGAGFQTESVTLHFSGNFYTVTDLLYRLRTQVVVRRGTLDARGRLFAVNTVSLTPTETNGLDTTVTLTAYSYGGPPPAPAPVATDTSTDTTSSTPASTDASAAGANP